MKRKLVLQGNATLMVSLPSDWVKAHGLSKGDEVDLTAIGNSVSVVAGSVQTKSVASVSLKTQTESSIRSSLTVPYRKGFSRIDVTYETTVQYALIQKIVRTRLLGFDIVSNAGNKCVIESISEPSLDQFDTILRKIFSNISLLFDVTIAHCKKEKSVESYEEISHRIQEYENFCLRSISRNALSKQKNEFLWAFLTILVHAARELHHINAIALKQKIPAQYISLLASGKEMLSHLETAYVRKEISGLDFLHDTEKLIVYDNGYDLLKKTATANGPVLYHIILIGRQLYLCSSSLAGAIL